MKIPDEIKRLMQKLLDNSFEAYIVGGAVRNHMIGLEPKDYDIFTNATGEDILTIFPKGKILGGEERQAKILTVVVDGTEISQYRSNPDRTETGTSLDDHLRTCDFTMNAMYCDVNGEIHDPLNGNEDLQRGLVKAVGSAKDRLDEDNLRAFRAVRFFSMIGGSYDTGLLMELYKIDISDIPPERIKDEIMKIFKYEKGLSELCITNLLEKAIPETEELVGVGGGKHHKEDVYSHMQYAFVASCGVTDNPLLRFACAMHDIGKGVTAKNEDGNISFKKHNMVGVDMIFDIMNRLKFSKEETKYVVCLVRNHMFGFKMTHKNSVYARLFEDLRTHGVKLTDLLVVNYADQQANLNNSRESFKEYLDRSVILDKYYEMKYKKIPFATRDLDITGHDVMDILKIEPGPMVGEVLCILMEQVLEGHLENEKHDLRWYLRKLI